MQLRMTRDQGKTVINKTKYISINLKTAKVNHNMLMTQWEGWLERRLSSQWIVTKGDRKNDHLRHAEEGLWW